MAKDIKKQDSKSTALDTKKLLRQQTVSKVFSKSFAIIFLSVMAFLVIIPFYWMLNTSFKTGEEQDRLTPTLYPHEWTFENYRVAFLGKKYVRIQKYEKWLSEYPGKIKELDEFLKDNNNITTKDNAIAKIQEFDNSTDSKLKYKENYLPILDKFKYFEENDKKIKLLNKEDNDILDRIFDIDKELKTTTDDSKKQQLITEKKQLQERKIQIKEEVNKLYAEKKSERYLNLIKEEKEYLEKNNNTKYTSEYQGYLDIRDNYSKKITEKDQLIVHLQEAKDRINNEKNSPDDSFKVYIFHTLVVGISSTILGTFISIIGAFALSRLSFKGKNLVFTVMLSTMMIPGEMMVISNYITVSKFNWIETSATVNHKVYLAMIVPFLVTVFHIYLLRQTFKQIPDELYYAAKVDGTSDFKYLWKVMVPLAKSSIITIVILKLMGTWNAYIWPNLVSRNHKLITVWLRSAFTDPEAGRTALELQMAATVLVLLPLLFVFMFLRKYIMRGVSRGGTKG